MKCIGSFVFKNLTHRKAGTFKNADGVDVNYPSTYILKVDEMSENGDINERKFKVNENQIALINDLKSLEAYQKIELEFVVTLYTNRMTLEVNGVSVE